MRLIPLNGAVDTDLTVYFTIWLLDGITPALSEAGNQPYFFINNGSPNTEGIGTLVNITLNQYYAVFTAGVIPWQVGDIIHAGYAHAGITQPAPGDSEFQIVDTTTLVAQPTLPAIAYNSYVSVAEANVYFSQKLNRPIWPSTDPNKQLIALAEATRLIDRLNFGGDKADPNQFLQFPRGNTTVTPQIITTQSDIDIDPFTTTITKDGVIPTAIKIATCEVAYKLLDGVDPDAEIDRLATESQGFSNVKTIYNRKFIPEHYHAGIPSAIAWGYLLPYLRDPRSFRLSRSS